MTRLSEFSSSLKILPIRITIKVFLIFLNSLLCSLLNLPWWLIRAKTPAWITLLWHRGTCKIFQMRVHVSGDKLPNARAGLFLSNHLSYLDIVVLGSLVGAKFISRADVKNWPFFGYLARRQGTIFIDRLAKNTHNHIDQLGQEFQKPCPIIMFPEGTSSSGVGVLPFKSSLLAPLTALPDLPVQPVTIFYKGRYGLPMGRLFEPFYAWYGDMDLVPHIAELLSLGPVDIEVIFHAPIKLSDYHDRKEFAEAARSIVNQGLQNARTKFYG